MKKIKLTRGQFTLVDDNDYAVISKTGWRAVPSGSKETFYACRSVRVSFNGYGDHRSQFMHRVLMGPPPFAGAQVDHINGNGLDNTRKNLRWVTRSQNQMNQKKRADGRSKYKGVHRHKQSKKWQARIFWAGRNKSLGLFSSEEEAARAYDSAARQLFESFAKLNFPLKVKE